MASNNNLQHLLHRLVPRNNVESDDDSISVSSSNTVDCNSKTRGKFRFILRTYQKNESNEFASIRSLLKYIDEQKKAIREHFINQVEDIVRAKLALYSLVENRAQDTKIDEEKSALNEQQALIYQALASFDKETDRLKIYITDITKKDVEHAFKREFRRANARLPFYCFRSQIIETLSENNVLIIIGETGSGKTTQVPQYLLEAGLAGSRVHSAEKNSGDQRGQANRRGVERPGFGFNHE